MKSEFFQRAWDAHAATLGHEADPRALAQHRATWEAAQHATLAYAVTAHIDPSRAMAAITGEPLKEPPEPPPGTRKILDPLWRSFSEVAVPHDAPEVQRREMRRAFYAGARGITGEIMRAVSEGDEITEEDEHLIEMVEKEFKDFYEAVMAGKA